MDKEVGRRRRAAKERYLDPFLLPRNNWVLVGVGREERPVRSRASPTHRLTTHHSYRPFVIQDPVTVEAFAVPRIKEKSGKKDKRQPDGVAGGEG